jgi:hypothetical protein
MKEKWDELLTKPEAKRVMREMAREAREDYRAGRTTDIEVTEDGRLAPAPTANSPCSHRRVRRLLRHRADDAGG